MDNEKPNIYLGLVNDKKVFWHPRKEKNQHLLIVGTSGSGKTETLRAIIWELKKNGVPSLIIDFHNEFRDVTDYHINMRDLTINPLDVIPGKRPQDVVYEVANILRKIFKLGDIQEGILRNAIRWCYEDGGIDVKEKFTGDSPPPVFTNVWRNINNIQRDKSYKYNRSTVQSLLTRVEPLFEVDIFREKTTEIPFEKIIEKTTAIELKDFPTEDVKSAIAEFFLNKLIYYLYTLGKTDDLRLYCVIDEAHRLMYENSPLDRLLRESRKYGTGVILSSQRPSDFSETVLANAGAILSLQCNLEKDAKFVSKQINIDPLEIKNLTEPGLGYVKFSSELITHKIKIELLDNRLNEDEKREIERKIAEDKETKELRKYFLTTKELKRHISCLLYTSPSPRD